MILTDSVVLKYSLVHNKFQGQTPLGSREESF